MNLRFWSKHCLMPLLFQKKKNFVKRKKHDCLCIKERAGQMLERCRFNLRMIRSQCDDVALNEYWTSILYWFLSLLWRPNITLLHFVTKFRNIKNWIRKIFDWLELFYKETHSAIGNNYFLQGASFIFKQNNRDSKKQLGKYIKIYSHKFFHPLFLAFLKI